MESFQGTAGHPDYMSDFTKEYKMMSKFHEEMDAPERINNWQKYSHEHTRLLMTIGPDKRQEFDEFKGFRKQKHNNKCVLHFSKVVAFWA